MIEERCKHELLIGQCDLCKPRAVPDPFTTPARRPLWGEPGPWFTARYDGRCGSCREPIARGDDIRMIAHESIGGRCCDDD